MNRNSLQLAVMIGCTAGFLALHSFALHSSAWSQVPRRGPEHPSHRYLPLPDGKGTLSDQIHSLEQLSQAFGSENENGAEGSVPFELSPAQLKQLDSVIESFRDENGQLNVPSPDTIPKQLIERFLPDPKQREQAQELLKEYARSRNLPLNNQPGTAPTNPTANAGRTQDRTQDRNDATDRSSPGSVNPSSADPNSREPTSNSMPSNRSSNNSSTRKSNGSPFPTPTETRGNTNNPSGNNDSSDSQPPSNVSPELRRLLETLKQIQGQQAFQEFMERNNSAASARESSSSRSSANNNDSRNGSASRDSRSSSPPKPPKRNTNNTNPQRSGTQANGTQPNNSRRSAQPNGNGTNRTGSDGRNPADRLNDSSSSNNNRGNEADNGSLGNQPTGSELLKNDAGSESNRGDAGDSSKNRQAAEPDKPKLTPFDPGYDFSADQNAVIDPSKDPFAEPKSSSNRKAKNANSSQSTARPKEPFNVTRMSEQPQSTSPNGTNQPEMDLKKSVNDLGLGPVLQRIVQKTIQEKGFNSGKAGPSPLANPNNPSGNPQSQSPPATSGFNGPLQPPPLPSAEATEKLTKWANSVATAPANGANNSSASSNTGWGKWISDTWTAVAQASARSSQGMSPTSTTPSPPSFSLPEARWTNSMTAAVIVFAALAGVLFWLSRRRVAELSNASAAQAEWVRTVIAQGLKTRADVIRAFHQLVKQSRAVSDWWTHRSVVKHFHSQSPQLGSAINELAIVYEQARYYPEDVELSQQQLAQVRSLLESVKIPPTGRV